MMRALLILPLLCLTWPAASLAAPSLDLTPISKEVRVDGASRRLVFFRSANTASGRLTLVEYAAPWAINGGRDCAIMSIPGMDACASIKSLELDEPLDLEDPEAVGEWVKKLIPTGAAGFQIEEIVKDPVRLNEHGTVEVIMCYSFFGRPLQVSAFLCQRRGQRKSEVFLFQLATTPLHFKQVHKTFLASLYSIVGF